MKNTNVHPKTTFSKSLNWILYIKNYEIQRKRCLSSTYNNLYHYAANNPVRYIDPTGAFDWDNNIIVPGDTLTKITDEFNAKYETNYSVDEFANKCGIANKDFIKAGDTLDFSNLLPTWNVTGRGDGVGGFAAFIPFLSNLSEIDKSVYSLDFTIEETGEHFSQKFTSINTSGDGIKIGAGVYTVSITAKGTFKGRKPSRDEIINSFAGSSSVVGFSFLWFGVTGSEDSTWTTNTGTIGFSTGLPFSYGIENSTTKVR